MDPLTHALAGTAASGTLFARRLGRSAWLPGAAGGLLPDVDALIRSSTDPLLYAEFHRHFTHALAFIPIGGAVAALPWLLMRHSRPRWPWYAGAAMAGYATHGLLDAATTYGTTLFWPFSDARVAWNIISIVDPLFTLVLLTGVAIAVWRQHATAAAVALLLCTGYLGLGAVQRDRALDQQAQIAALRGDVRERGAVFPGAGTTLVWRSLYLSGDTLHMDRIRVPIVGPATWRPGYRMPYLRNEDLPPNVRGDERLLRQLRRFRVFADGWVARAPGEPDIIGDARYSASTERFEPVWGIRFEPDSEAGVQWIDRSRGRRVDVGALWDELRGLDPEHRLLTPPGER